MYKVLIVDDDILARNYLVTLIPWQAFDFRIAGQATNGSEAMMFIEASKPDIVLLDMNMPGMSGVELCKWMQEKDPTILFIVLSSYDTFDFVRESLKSGAIDYLLKHEVHAENLLEVLNKAKVTLDNRSSAMKRNEELERNWDMTNHRKAIELIRELLLGRNADVQLVEEHLTRNLGMELKNVIIITLQVVHFSMLTDSFTENEKQIYIRSIRDLYWQSHVDGNQLFFYFEDGRFAALLSYPEHRSEGAIAQKLDSELRRLEKAMHHFLNVRIVFGASAAANQLLQARNQFLAASRLLEDRLLQQFTGAKTGDGLEEATPNPATFLRLDQERDLLTALNLQNRTQVHAIVQQIFSSLKDSRIQHAATIQNILKELLTIAHKVWRNRGLGDMKPSNNYTSGLWKEQAERCMTVVGMRTWVTDYYDVVLDEMIRQDTRAKTPYVNQAITYIRNHYAENISLELVAKSIGITPSYLGRLFKDEVAQSFTEFVNQHRVTMSKQLFEQGMSIKHIYESVGFSSYNYFFKVFKDIEGVTPQTFVKCKLQR
jgi:two-component system response regulator YesN